MGPASPGKFCKLHWIGPDTPPKPIADADKWAQRMFGKFCKLHRMSPELSQEVSSIISDGPRHAAKTAADVNKWAQRLPESSANYIGWAQTRHQNPLLILINGPSAFSESSANYIGWAQCFPKTFRQ